MCGRQAPVRSQLEVRQSRIVEVDVGEAPSDHLQSFMRYLRNHFAGPSDTVGRKQLARLKILAAAVEDPEEKKIVQRCLARVPKADLRPLVLPKDTSATLDDFDASDWSPDEGWSPPTPTAQDLQQAREHLRSAHNFFKSPNQTARNLVSKKLREAIALVPDLDALRKLLPKRSVFEKLFSTHKSIDTFRDSLDDDLLETMRDEVLEGQRTTWLDGKRQEHLDVLETQRRVEQEEENLAEVADLIPIGAALLARRWKTFVDATRADTRNARRQRVYNHFRRQAQVVRQAPQTGPGGLASSVNITSFVNHVRTTWTNRRHPNFSASDFASDVEERLNALGRAAHPGDDTHRSWTDVDITAEKLSPNTFGDTKPGQGIKLNKMRIEEFLKAEDDGERTRLLRLLCQTAFHEVRHWEQGLFESDVYDYGSCNQWKQTPKHRASKSAEERSPTPFANHNMERVDGVLRRLTSANPVLKTSCGGDLLKVSQPESEVEDLIAEALVLAAYSGKYTERWFAVEAGLTALPGRWTELLEEWEDFYREYRDRQDEWDAHLVGDLVDMAWDA